MLNGTRSATLQRRLKIVDLIRRHDAMRVEDLSLMFGVSAVTIRSDLAYLDDQGLVQRSFGKAIAPGDKAGRPQQLSRQEAEPILAACAQLVGQAAQLFLGPGELPLRLLPFLRQSSGLGVLLARIDAVLLARQCLDGPVQLIGGEVQEDGMTLGGAQAEAHLSQQLLDTAVFEIGGLGSEGALIAPLEARGLALAASGRAGRRIGLVAAAAPAEPGREPGLGLDIFDHLILPPSAQPALLDIAAGHGFEAREGREGAILMQAAGSR